MPLFVFISVNVPAFTYTYISGHIVAEDTTGKSSMPRFSDRGRTGVLEFKIFPLIILLRSYVVHKNLGVFYYISAV